MLQGEGKGVQRKNSSDFGLHWKLLKVTCSDCLNIGRNNSRDNHGPFLNARQQQQNQGCFMHIL